MKTYTSYKKVPVYAGMLNGKMGKIKIVGYDTIKFIFNSKEKDQLIREERIERVFNTCRWV